MIIQSILRNITPFNISNFKKVPYVQQMKDSDCGHASLAMILRYYGFNTSVTEVSKVCESYGSGVSVKSIVKAASDYNLVCEVYNAEIEQIFSLEFPMIIHWNFNHFVVLEKIKNDKAVIVDPALGRREVDFDEFDKAFTGVCITLKPTENFTKENNYSNVGFKTILKSVFFRKENILTILSVAFFAILLQAAAITTPLLLQYSVDHVINAKLDSVIPSLMWSILFFIISIFSISYFRAGLIVSVQQKVDNHLVTEFIRRLLDLPIDYFLHRSSGDIQSRLNSNTVIRDVMSTSTVTSIIDSALAITYASMLYFISPKFLVVVLGLAILQIATFTLLSNSIKEKISSEVKVQAKYQSYLVELINGIMTVKSTATEKKGEEKFLSLFNSYLVSAKNRNLAEGFVSSITGTLRLASPTIVLLYSVHLYFNGELSLGVLLAINSIAMLFLTPLLNMTNLIRQIQFARVHGERLGEIWLHKTESELTNGEMQLSKFSCMEVKNISHSYFRDGELVLKDISFSISKGEKVAIVGASGSGKTTLMNLLLGFIKPQSGSILVNGSDISTYAKEDIRKCFGIVPQKSFLFNMSVKDNISISKLDMNEQDIIKAAKIACIHSDIEKMPMKYESIVGEGGDLLSGGQKQRLCIARALVNNPDILFLDEATSSLDSESEKNISKNLECLNNAQLIIAHRMSTVVNCDKILVLNNGELVNIGKHSELLEKCNIYRKMISNQNLTMN